jgi:hypothetical protein
MESSVFNFANLNIILEELEYDFRVKPLGNGGKYFWIYHVQNKYAIKVIKEFVELLEHACDVEVKTEDSDEIVELFSKISSYTKSPFVIYDKMGFVTKDYAEFFLEYIIADEASMSHPMSDRLLEQNKFYVGDTVVEIGRASSMLTLVNRQYEDDNLFDIWNYPAVKIKGTSSEGFEDDLYAALYYLRLIEPSIYGDVPKIRRLKTEEDLYDRDFLENENPSINFKKPKYFVPLRFYYHAEALTGDEAILYYYKVLEYFFETAWRKRVEFLVSDHQQDTNALVIALTEEQPKNEEAYLRLVLNCVKSDTLWEALENEGIFVQDINSLAQSIYKIRNRVAHGKSSFALELITPSLVPSQETIIQRQVVKTVAYQTLKVLAEVDYS